MRATILVCKGTLGMTYPVFDLHCDTADRLAWQTLPATLREQLGSDTYGPGDEAEPERIRELAENRGHLSLKATGDLPWAQCFACYIPDELTPEQALAFCRHVRGYLDEQLSRNGGRTSAAEHAQDIRRQLVAEHIVAVHTIENATLFAHDLSLIEELACSGVLMASLSWNAPGPLASGHDAPERGLTELGRAALAEMERAHMVVDVSHLNDRCFDEVASLTERPFVASHSNSRAVCGHRRNLTDAQFDEIRDRGGLVGLNFADIFLSDKAPGTEPTFDDISRHIDHWLELGGERVIALGSDFDGCDTPPVIETAAQMAAFQQRLEKRFGARITQRLCSENALAFFERWGR